MTKTIKEICEDPAFKEAIKVTAMSWFVDPAECLRIMETNGAAMREYVNSRDGKK
ncbi:hypothetical protein FACS1894187_09470 [Synergistales bacterium]|nr:hypothetical protein FACS1894187_09470 [Synergistales bacterium]